MHEQSLVKSLLDQVRKLCDQQITESVQPVCVSEIQVEMGPLSGVEPILLETAFETLAPGSFAENAKLTITEVPLCAYCQKCKLESEIEDFVFRCPRCQGNMKVTAGDGFYLVGVSYMEKELV